MKKQKTKNRGDFYGETVLNIAAHNCYMTYSTWRKVSKRTLTSGDLIFTYLDNLQKQNKKKR